MITYLHPERFYSNRSYLTQWFPDDILVVIDSDFQNPSEVKTLLEQTKSKYIIDITHNPYKEEWLQIGADTILTNNFQFWYDPKPNYVFFPLFLWMYSLRTNLWWSGFSFDTGSNKTKGLMCLNNRPRPHRTWLWNRFNHTGSIAQMVFSFTKPDANDSDYSWQYPLNIDNEDFNLHRNDVGVDHRVYYDCAVNLVTETCTDFTYISEKTCKPFIARQIPIIVSSHNINKFLSDIGLDMFGDIVPWHTWDSDTDELSRLSKIADFVESWTASGTMLSDYKRVLDRVERNKQYFHSEAFRNRIMNQMLNFKPA